MRKIITTAALTAIVALLSANAIGPAAADENKTYVFCTGNRIAISLFASYGSSQSFVWCLLYSSTDSEKARQFARKLGGEGARCDCG
jgi:hypothetical protein